ncbi:MAG: phage minor head protein [Bacteroidetes bacterium]|nr:phage minor head protein [Bacteroidota bacterium]
MPLRKALIDLMYYNGNPPADDLITLADDNDPLVKKLYAGLLKRAKEMIKNVHEKKTVPGDIDKEMVSLTHQILMDGVTKGLKVDWDKVDYETDDGKKLHALQTHVFKFSACKNYQEVLAMGRNLTDEKGNIRPFDEFRKVAGKIDSTFNGSWLRTEYHQAQVTATRIADYRRMEGNTDIYPTWQYKTRADGHVREPHKALHDMKLAANDPAWNAIYPTNGWNCRCWVKPLSDDPPHTGKGEEAIAKLRSTIVSKKTGMSEWDNMVKQGFNQNFAKTGTCYPANHQYFKAGEALSVQAALSQFNPQKKNDSFNTKVSSATTTDEVADILKNELSQLGHDKVSISFTEIDTETAKVFAGELTALCKKYRVDAVFNEFYTKKLPKLNGIVNASITKTTVEKRMNVSSETKPDRIQPEANSASRCDPDKLNVSTLNHEFGHLLWLEEEMGANAVAFKGKISKINSQYFKEIKNRIKQSKDYSDIYLGKYGSIRKKEGALSEFVAEAFQEYRNKKNPSKFALEVGKVVDEHFKK